MEKKVWAEALRQMTMIYAKKLRCEFYSVCADGSKIKL